MGSKLRRSFFETHFLDCARDLIGCELVWNGCAGVIVETEAYGVVDDEACHTFTRAAARAFVEENRAGTAYVYLNYGVHWLLNVLVKGGPVDGIILLRALEPTAGVKEMERRRGTAVRTALCSGPGKLARALEITGADHRRDLCGVREVGFRARKAPVEVVADTRIGISKAAHLPWRFLLKDSRFVSVKLQSAKKARPENRPGLAIGIPPKGGSQTTCSFR